MAPTETTARVRQIGNVTIPVADADRAIAFYVNSLGFEVRRDAQFGGGLRWVEVAPAGAATTIALAPPGTGSIGVDTGIRLLTTNAEATHEALRQGGTDIDDILRYPNVPPMFSFRDPDGNTLYMVEG